MIIFRSAVFAQRAPEAEDVAIDDLDALLEGTRSQMRASDCRVFGQVKDLRAGGELVLNCSSSTL